MVGKTVSKIGENTRYGSELPNKIDIKLGDF